MDTQEYITMLEKDYLYHLKLIKTLTKRIIALEQLQKPIKFKETSMFGM